MVLSLVAVIRVHVSMDMLWWHVEQKQAVQQHAMDWWLVDSSASAHIISKETLQRLQIVSASEAASKCVSAMGNSIGVRRSAVVRVPFVLVSEDMVLIELQVQVASVKLIFFCWDVCWARG